MSVKCLRFDISVYATYDTLSCLFEIFADVQKCICAETCDDVTSCFKSQSLKIPFSHLQCVSDQETMWLNVGARDFLAKHVTVATSLECISFMGTNSQFLKVLFLTHNVFLTNILCDDVGVRNILAKHGTVATSLEFIFIMGTYRFTVVLRGESLQKLNKDTPVFTAQVTHWRLSCAERPPPSPTPYYGSKGR